MKTVTLLMAGDRYEGSSIMAIFSSKEDADREVEKIEEWQANRPPIPDVGASEEEWDKRFDYDDTFPYAGYSSSDSYYTVVWEVL